MNYLILIASIALLFIACCFAYNPNGAIEFQKEIDTRVHNEDSINVHIATFILNHK